MLSRLRNNVLPFNPHLCTDSSFYIIHPFDKHIAHKPQPGFIYVLYSFCWFSPCLGVVMPLYIAFCLTIPLCLNISLLRSFSDTPVRSPL
ncbi:hypothetical protein BDV93DRAFT_276025 [Ceratobasidium sp. AG-I]|nr:hypothetical protein BDV93DRAFT_276025 [Ceratobasidium sp. AG-I]